MNLQLLYFNQNKIQFHIFCFKYHSILNKTSWSNFLVNLNIPIEITLLLAILHSYNFFVTLQVNSNPILGDFHNFDVEALLSIAVDREMQNVMVYARTATSGLLEF